MTQAVASTAAGAVKPSTKPQCANFSSGPAAKRPGWTPDVLKSALLGRSHRSGPGKARLKEAIDRTKALLKVPADFRVAIVAASDTGAVEMAMWTLLGSRPVDLFAWETFGKEWVTDATKQLKPLDARVHEATYGELPDLSKYNPDHDCIFTYNGTSSGVKVPNTDWISANRTGITICDATSAVFAMPMDWSKLDVTTFSWQKVLGGEAAHGIIILSPRAVAQLESYKAPWPVPKIFRFPKKDGKLTDGLFQGETINTPSMLCVEDALDAMKWAESIGGLEALIARTSANFKAINDWVEKTPWVEFLCKVPTQRSTTSVTLKFSDPAIAALSREEQMEISKKISSLLEKEGVGNDINHYRDCVPGFRIWAGATVEASDIAALLPWLDWAYGQVVGSRDSTLSKTA